MLPADRSALRQKPIPRVLSRYHLLMGAEREPLLVCAFTLGGVAMTSMNFVAAFVCGALWLAALTALRWMAKVIPDDADLSAQSALSTLLSCLLASFQEILDAPPTSLQRQRARPAGCAQLGLPHR